VLKEKYWINGQITARKADARIEGLRVEVWDKELVFDDLVGVTVTDSDGCFQLEFDRSKLQEVLFLDLFFDRRPDLFFKIYRDDVLIKSTEDSILWNVDVGETELTIEVDLPPACDDNAYSVLVTARQSNGKPLSGMTIKVFDIDVGVETPLGTKGTDNKGHCEIRYTQKQLSLPNKKYADILVRAFTPDGDILCESETIFNARRHERVELVTDLPEQPARSEYENLQRTVTPLLGDLSPADLAPKDIAYLLKKHKGKPLIDERRLRVFSEGSRIARDSGIPAEFIYGLAHSRDFQLPLSLNALIQLTDSDIREGLSRAIEDDIVSPKIGETIDEHLARINQLKLDRGLLVRRDVFARLIDEKTGKSLSGFRVHASHVRADEGITDLGYDLTDNRGRFSFSIVVVPDTTSEETNNISDSLQLSIFDAQQQGVYETEIAISITPGEILDIEIPHDKLPKPPTYSISGLVANLKLQLP
jgi:hypothetical protein